MSLRSVPPRGARRVAAVCAALLVLAARPGAGGEARRGRQGCDFKGTDFLTNGALDLEQSLGKRVILLDFGSIYCSSCMVTVPNLIKLRKRFPQDDLAIFNIYLDIYNPQRVVKFFRGFAGDLNVSLLIDDKLAISREYGVDTLPTTIIIDRGGVIRRRIVGYTEADEKEIDVILDRLVSELPAAATPGQPRRSEEPFTVFVPESFTKTRQDKVHLVGYIGGAGARDVTVKLNNLPERVVTAKEGVFHLQTSLSLAMNLIEIRGQEAGGGAQSQSVVLFRETLMGGDINSDLPEYRFHRDEDKKPCRKCHALEVPDAEKDGLRPERVLHHLPRRPGQAHLHPRPDHGRRLPPLPRLPELPEPLRVARPGRRALLRLPRPGAGAREELRLPPRPGGRRLLRRSATTRTGRTSASCSCARATACASAATRTCCGSSRCQTCTGRSSTAAAPAATTRMRPRSRSSSSCRAKRSATSATRSAAPRTCTGLASVRRPSSRRAPP